MSFAWAPPAQLRSRAPVEIWNVLVSHCGRPFPLTGKGVTASVEPAESPRQAQVAALLESGGLRAIVIFDAFPFMELFEAPIEAADLEHLPLALRDVLVKGMVSSLWSLIPENRLPRYTILGIGDWQESATRSDHPLDWVSVAIKGLAKSPVQLRIGCVATDIAQALAGGKFAARAAWEGLRSSLTAEASILLGWMSASIADVRRLAPGDVIVLADTCGERRFMRCDHDLQELELGAEGWTCVGSAMDRAASDIPQERNSAVSEEDAAQTDELKPLASLMLDLDFEIGRMSVALGTIETWRPGALVELSAPDIAEGLEITIRANGQAIAKGDLIQIDERLAIRLTRLLVAG